MRNFNGAAIDPRVIVFMGASITGGHGVTPAFPDIVGPERGYRRTVNSGISGNSTHQMLARYETDLLEHYPGQVCLDLYPQGATIVELEENSRAMIEKSLTQGSLITIMPAPRNNDPDVEAGLVISRDLANALAVEYDLPAFNFHDELEALDEVTRDAMYIDITHFSVAGHEFIAEQAIAQGLFIIPGLS